MSLSVSDALRSCEQDHLVTLRNELSEEDRADFDMSFQHVDLKKLASVSKDTIFSRKTNTIDSEIPRTDNIFTPVVFPTKAIDDTSRVLRAKAIEVGKTLVSDRKVAALTVAGGMGTRLGWDKPKGTYPISPISGKSLFELFAEQLTCLEELLPSRSKSSLTWFILTSPDNDKDTRDFFAQNHFFGRSTSSIIFVLSQEMPVFDTQTGRILLDSSRLRIVTSPNGHGGVYRAMWHADVFQRMKANGIEHLSYLHVDNPLMRVIDPLFLGLSVLADCPFSVKVLKKSRPEDRLGNVIMTADKVHSVVEYSDLPSDLATARDSDGELIIRYGFFGGHIMQRDFAEKIATSSSSLRYHTARKIVDGKEAIKLEQFVFDVLPLSRNVVILECSRERHFGPVKNSSGDQSPLSSKHLFSELCRHTLNSFYLAGREISIPEGFVVEIPWKLILRGEFFTVKNDDALFRSVYRHCCEATIQSKIDKQLLLTLDDL